MDFSLSGDFWGMPINLTGQLVADHSPLMDNNFTFGADNVTLATHASANWTQSFYITGAIILIGGLVTGALALSWIVMILKRNAEREEIHHKEDELKSFEDKRKKVYLDFAFYGGLVCKERGGLDMSDKLDYSKRLENAFVDIYVLGPEKIIDEFRKADFHPSKTENLNSVLEKVIPLMAEELHIPSNDVYALAGMKVPEKKSAPRPQG